MARMLLALAAAAAILAAPSAAFAQAAPSNPTRGSRRARAPGRRALRCRGKARLDRREDRSTAQRVRSTCAQRFRVRTRMPVAGWSALRRHRLDTAVAEADIALGAVPACAAPTADRDRLAARRADRPAAREPGAAPGVSRAKARVRSAPSGTRCSTPRRSRKSVSSGADSGRHSRRASRRRISLRPTPRSRGSAAAGTVPKRRGASGRRRNRSDTRRMTTILCRPCVALRGRRPNDRRVRKHQRLHDPYPNVGTFRRPTLRGCRSAHRTVPAARQARQITVDATSSPPPTAQEVDGMLRMAAAKLGADAAVVVVDTTPAGPRRCERDLVGPHADEPRRARGDCRGRQVSLGETSKSPRSHRR